MINNMADISQNYWKCLKLNNENMLTQNNFNIYINNYGFDLNDDLFKKSLHFFESNNGEIDFGELYEQYSFAKRRWRKATKRMPRRYRKGGGN